MNKRYVSLFSFVAILILAAVACGGGQTPAEQPAEQPAPVEGAPPTQPPAASNIRPDIPLMADAANVITAETADEYSVTYDSASSLDVVTAFYQAEMPKLGWAYKAEVSTVTGAVNAVLAFDKGDERAAVTLNGVGAGTQVTIGVKHGAAGNDTAAATEAPANEPTAAASLSQEVREDIPLMADAANVITAETADEYSVTYDSASSLDVVTAFYQAEMPKLGWAYKAEVSTVTGAVNAVLAFDKGDERAAVTLNGVGAGTQVTIGVKHGAADEGAAVVTETPSSQPSAAGSGGQLTCQDIPLMADAVGVSIVKQADDCVVSYTSASGMDAVVAFYQSELPTLGWTYNGSISSVVSGVNAVLYFTQNGQEAAVTVTNMVTTAQVVVALEGGATAEENTGGEADSESASSGSVATCPGIPLMADAAGIGSATEGDDCVVSYTSASGVDAVVSFYQGQMPGYGWSYNGNISSVASGVSAVLYFTQGSQEAAVTVSNEGGVAKVVVAVKGGK